MTCLRVDIVGFLDESVPGFARCAFADANGNRQTFIEKIPVVTTQDLWRDSVYPQQGTVPCEKVESLAGGTGRALARVTIGVGGTMEFGAIHRAPIAVSIRMIAARKLRHWGF